MNGTEPKVEIFAPFGAAYEWMKTVLFRPFDLTKWLVIAFAAFLSGSWGGGINLRLGDLGDGDWKFRSSRHGEWPTDWSLPAWAIALIILGVLLALLIAAVVMWISARGRFIFTDCVVKNRAAIAEPWREYRREGNSFFLFSLAVAAAVVVLAAISVLIIAVPLGFLSENKAALTSFGPAAIVAIIIVVVVWVVFSLFFALVTQFMVPVMYRRRCSAKDAFLDVTNLIFRYPGEFVLFVLFAIVVAIGVAVIGTLVACMTCCIGALPYISTVLLLPAIVWVYSFKLLFLRQFGDAYDAWATVGLPQPPASPTPPPAGGPAAPPLPPPPVAP